MSAFKITSREHAYAVLAEVARLAQTPEPAFVDENFPKQAAFIKDPAKRKSVKCTRRAGKSYGFGRILYQEAYNNPGCSCLYIGLTRATARNIMWKDVMKDLNKKLALSAHFNETTLTTKLPNGSEIHLIGADTDADEMEKVLGGKYRVVIVDEGGSFRIDLRKLLYENLEPALADWDGYAVLGGTPTEYTKGLFYDVTKDVGERERGWSVHEWNTFDNPYMAEKWQSRLSMLKETNPRIEETPSYKRMYLGQWVTDTEDLVYKFDPTRNTLAGLPKQPYTYLLGVDLGFSPDPSAFVVAAYSETDKNLYFIEAFKKTGMIISDVAERIRYYQGRFPFARIVIDGAAKQSVEELKQRYQLPLTTAEKQGKAEFIEIMNSEFIQGRIKLVSCDELADEYAGLIWDKDAFEKKGRREEHPGCANHLGDAALYAWRYCYNYMSVVPRAALTTEQKIDEWEDKEADRFEQNRFKPFWERDYA